MESQVLLCGFIFLVMLQGKFEILITLGNERERTETR